VLGYWPLTRTCQPTPGVARSEATRTDPSRSEITPAHSKVSVPGSSPLTPPFTGPLGVEAAWDGAGAAAQYGGTGRDSGCQVSLQFTTAHTVLP